MQLKYSAVRVGPRQGGSFPVTATLGLAEPLEIHTGCRRIGEVFAIGGDVVVRTGMTRRVDMMDVLYLGLIVGFLALSLGLVELCDRLSRGG
jgi:hypothetical protein